MVGYYPQRQDGELLYSATARLAAAIFSGRSVAYCAERLLGNSHLSFGFLIPNHVDRLLENIPTVTGMTREDALRGSVYYLQAPLLDAREREKLSMSLIAGSSTDTNGLRTFNARWTTTSPKYCVACARRDADLAKPAIWRVLHNHHGSIACAEHGIRLQTSDAPIGGSALCDPNRWIKPDIALPPTATPAELSIARDFAWIYDQHANSTPGFQKIAMKLRESLLNRAEFTIANRLLDTAKILKAVRENLSEPAQEAFAPLIWQLTCGRTLNTHSRTTLHAYCLLAFLGGTSLSRVLKELSDGSDFTIPQNCVRGNNQGGIRFHKDRIEAYLVAHPDCSRQQIGEALPNSVERVRAVDLKWYESRMPVSLSWQPGKPQDRNWPERDIRLCDLAARYLAAPGAVPFRSFRDALVKLNQSRSVMRRAHGRLPRFRALVESLINPDQAAA